jgi:Protein of unknown function (DUF3500)
VANRGRTERKVFGMLTRCTTLLLLLTIGCAAPQSVTVDPAVAEVVVATDALLRGLTPELRAKAQRAFDDDERTKWAFVPGRYAGVEFGDLDADGNLRLKTLLRTLLSARGLATTMAIVQLEDVLRTIESRGGRDASHRDVRRYALSIAGEPGLDGAFAIRLQGHHVSLHFTFFAGWLVGTTPHFLGTNPHELREGPEAGQRILAAEEDLARELLASLDEAQRRQAIVAAQAPPDVLLGPGAGFDRITEQGLSHRQMNERQRRLLWDLVEQFALRLRGEFAAAELLRIDAQLDSLRFVWMGGTERGQGHYWRLQGSTFVLEYDNTQNDANHVHTVWRDRERDFGADPLRRHLEQEHGAAR